MRRSLIALSLGAALLPAAAIPTAATAQSRDELRHDRRDVRHERRDVDRAERNGHWRRAEHERHELRDARQEYREDRHDRRWGRDDWRGWREHNRGLYGRGGWRAPFRYTAFQPGVRLNRGYYAATYYLADPWRYRLPPISGYQRWVRHYDDLLLVDIRTGYVRRVIRGFYW